MKPRTLVAHQRYFGLDPSHLRLAAGRALTRVVGLPPGRDHVRTEHLRQDFALDTVAAEALVREMTEAGLLRPRRAAPGSFELTENFRALAGARVVAPLPRARARQLVDRARDLALDINASWSRNPLDIDTLAVCGGYMSRDVELCELTLGVVVRSRSRDRRARWGRMDNRQAGACAMRDAIAARSSVVVVHLLAPPGGLARPFSVVFRADD
jgi:hypothetical protein